MTPFLRFKKGCKVGNAAPPIVIAMNVWAMVCARRDCVGQVNSVSDGKHSSKSKHNTGNAFDGDTHDTDSQGKRYCIFAADVHEVIKEFADALPEGYDVIYEGTPGNEHMHCEYDPTMSEF